jgi:tetratricopeptide (TPR) repeat protein
MKRIIIYLIILLPVVAPAVARTVEMTLHPSKASEPSKKYSLLPKADEQINADAVPLYEKALQSMPSDLQMEKVEQWLKTPPNELPLQQVQSALKQVEPSLALHEQAAKCKLFDWPYWDWDVLTENSRKHRRLIFFLALKVRFQVAQGRYNEAIGTAQTGFAMARHLGEGPSLIHGLFGIGIAAYMCRQLEALVQRPDAPNLYEALRELPQPFIDLTEQAEWEEPDIKERVHLLMNRLDRHLAILQCIEAMRLYIAAHEGRFPKQLSDITLVGVPDDPVTGKPFIFSRTGSKAVLEGPAPKGELAKQAIRYELNLVE